MRVRLIEAGATSWSEAIDVADGHLPNVGDLVSVEYGDSVRTTFRVRQRMFRIYAVTQALMVAEIEVERVDPDEAHLTRLG